MSIKELLFYYYYYGDGGGGREEEEEKKKRGGAKKIIQIVSPMQNIILQALHSQDITSGLNPDLMLSQQPLRRLGYPLVDVDRKFNSLRQHTLFFIIFHVFFLLFGG